MPLPGTTIEVAPACLASMPLPFKLDHINLGYSRSRRPRQAVGPYSHGIGNDRPADVGEISPV